jgi:hypothetical protein
MSSVDIKPLERIAVELPTLWDLGEGAFRLPFAHSYFTSPKLRGARLNQTGQNGPNMLHLIVVYGVTHAWIDAFGRVAAQAAKDSRRLLDSRQRDVGIYIATTNEHRRARQ